MQRRLVLVRHAKSSWDDPAVDDHDRPLAPRGLDALPRLRAHLARSTWRPEVVLCSSARRTVDTLSGIRSALPDDVVIEFDAGLYAAGASDVQRRLQRLEPGIACALVIGHNPGLHDLAASLAVEGSADLREQLAVKFPTGALATILVDAEWAQLTSARGRLEELFTPRRPRR